MKKNITLSLLALAILMALSCKNERREPEGGSETEKSVLRVPTKKDTVLLKDQKNKTMQRVGGDNLDMSFIGKTTQDLNQYNFHECFGAIIGQKSEKGKYAIAQYPATVADCQNGKSKITLEKFIQYVAGGKANFEIKDELSVINKYPEKCYVTIFEKLTEDEPKKHYLIEHEGNSNPILTKIDQMWEVSIQHEKFIKIAIPKDFTCQNPYYADGI